MKRKSFGIEGSNKKKSKVGKEKDEWQMLQAKNIRKKRYRETKCRRERGTWNRERKKTVRKWRVVLNMMKEYERKQEKKREPQCYRKEEKKRKKGKCNSKIKYHGKQGKERDIRGKEKS